MAAHMLSKNVIPGFGVAFFLCLLPATPKGNAMTTNNIRTTITNIAGEIESLGMLLAAVSGDVEQPDAHRIGSMISNRAFDIKAKVEEITDGGAK
jgi:hypothetical protein